MVVCLLCWLVCLLACSFARSLAFLLAFLVCFACLPILICFAWLTCEACAVEHQKLNQTTPYGVVWLNFWGSTYLPLFALSWLGFHFSLVCLLILLWFGSLVWKACFAFVCLLCFALIRFALLCYALLCLLCFGCLVCVALLLYAMLDLLGSTCPGLT